ncbi:bifunctional sugar phosphate isomerase/epimerase/4-hydroxyphenylpyruvate dioxygenase family protein [Piscinibacter koreensis]|uniref:3-dehydroshikimate dehydratase n=1 Tax=Piscinibacter koreensis TaxID=2742824 RepID=A0A7Y6TWA3_9BURK|nr:sugar phosphate isomerase/epimerase and 4-hydroxyphenylpyruvate domain-containing protein [Schlegelella koreensis]NUZ05807.1 sugar phosphate isomerase/epimerase and 4-hydroxyphenylpyruvate domain-containing protein [Schlegelella koreensis]
MRRSTATVSLSGTLRQKLQAIAAARFDGIELFEPDFVSFDGSAAELAAMAGDLGLTIDLYQPLRDFEGMPDADHARNLKRAERKFDLMQALGAPTLLVCSNTSPRSLGDAERSAAQLHELAERAARRNLRIGYEALAWGRHVKRYREAWAIVERADHPHLGLILDSFHTLSLGDDPSAIATIPGEKIFFLQMADAPILAMDVLQWARHHRCFPGQGQFDLETFLARVLRAGYAGPLSLEIFNDVFRETPNRRTATDAMRSLLLLESQVRQRLAREAAESDDGTARAASERVALFDPPAVPRLGGYAFLEFAVDDTAAEALAALLHAMGFVRAGRHRSKAVTLYRQGAINLVINAEPDSFARRRFVEHGPSVCAIGIAAADAERAVNRAVALQSARFDGPRGARELAMPAIVSPGGNLVHFVAGVGPGVDPIGADFVAADNTTPDDGSGLCHVDHVALGLSPDQLDTWVLFSRAVLGLEPGDSLELADPFGLVRSLGVADRGRSLRIVFNTSSSRATRTALSASASGGVAVQHIAFACDDIVATVRQMRAAGVPFVPISANYYDDLAARIDLGAERLATLRELGILFDRSADGDYLHIYTASFAGRFFFEIVQRVGGYDAYGALNAPARLASEAQAAERGG